MTGPNTARNRLKKHREKDKRVALRHLSRKCAVCGNAKKLQVSHKVRVKFSTAGDLKNLEILCIRCHHSWTQIERFQPEGRTSTPLRLGAKFCALWSPSIKKRRESLYGHLRALMLCGTCLYHRKELSEAFMNYALDRTKYVLKNGERAGLSVPRNIWQLYKQAAASVEAFRNSLYTALIGDFLCSQCLRRRIKFGAQIKALLTTRQDRYSRIRAWTKLKEAAGAPGQLPAWRTLGA